MTDRESIAVKKHPAETKSSFRSTVARRLLVTVAVFLVIALPLAWLSLRDAPQVYWPSHSGDAPRDSAEARLETLSPGEAEPTRDGDAETRDERASDVDPAREAGDPAPAGAIRGVVLTPEGKAIPGARVEAEFSPRPTYAAAPDDPSPEESEAGDTEPVPARGTVTCLSDTRGRFEISGLPEGSYVLDVSARGFGRRRIADAPAREGAAGDEALRIVLQPELHVRGQVVDRRARAIEGAEVKLTFLAADASGLDWRSAVMQLAARAGAVHRARTDAEGRFDVGGLARGVYRAEAAGPGRVPTAAPFFVEVHERNDPEESRLLFELADARVIRGVVRSGKGNKALAGARVELFAGSIDTRSVLTGSDGAFELDGMAEVALRLDVSASGHRARSLEGVAVSGDHLVVTLEPASPLVGRVIDRSSGEPVPDAELRQSWDEMPAASSLARTDRDGQFRLASPPEGGAVILVRAVGYTTLEVEAPDAPPGGGWTLALDRSGSVSGRVRSPAKMPVEGLGVSLLRLASPDEKRSAHLYSGASSPDPDGFYRAFVTGSGTYRVIVDGEPYALAMSQPFTVPHDKAQIDGIDIALDLAGGAQGFVIAAGAGIAGARVRVFPDLPPEVASQSSSGEGPSDAVETALSLAGKREARTDATGAFALGGLARGVYRLVADAPGFVTARSDAFEVAPGVVQTVHVELEPEMTISGRVVDATGAPVAMAEIQAFPSGEGSAAWSEERSISSVLGTFRLSRLSARPYDLRVANYGFAPAAVWGVDAGAEDVEVRLEKLVSLSGRVIGAFTGEPAYQFKLKLELQDAHRLPASDRESLHRWREFSDPAGAFRVDELAPGRYILEASARGHLTLAELELDVPSEDVEIRLDESGLIAGGVVDPNGNAISGANVVALERRVDSERGTISYRPLRVPVLKPERSAAAAAEGDGAPPDDGGGGRRGRRREGGGRDGGGRDDDWMPAAASTKEDGSFFIRGLPDGQYRLSIAHDDYLPRELGELIVEAGVCANPSLASSILLPFGVVLRGRVRGLAEAQSGSLRISLRPVVDGTDPRAWRLATSKSARVDESGHFEIRGLATGDYILNARFRRASDGSAGSIRRDVNIHGAGREQGLLLDLSAR